MLTEMNGLGRARGDGVDRLGDHALAGAVLPGDEGRWRRRGRRARSISSTGRMAADCAMRIGPALAAQQLVLLLQPPVGADRAAQLDLVADDGDEPGVFPRLGDEVARAAPHGLDRHLDARPGGHDDDGQRRVDVLDLVEEVEALLAGGRVARVVEVHRAPANSRAPRAALMTAAGDFTVSIW